MAGKSGMDKTKGKAKEMTGKATGGHRGQELQGKVDQASGEARKARGKAQEHIRKGDRSVPRDPR